MSIDNYTKLPEPDHQDVLNRIGNEASVTVYRRKEGNNPETGKPYRGKLYMVVIRDPGAGGKKKKKAKKTLNEVVAYAQEWWSKFDKGTDLAGRVSTQEVLDIVVGKMKAKKRDQKTIDDFAAPIIAGIAKGLTNLNDDLIAAKVQHFLDNDYKPKCGYGVRKQMRGKRQQTKLLQSWRRLAKAAMRTLPRPMLLRDPFIALNADKCPDAKPKDMETIPSEYLHLLVSDEALSRREGLLWAFRIYTTTRASEGNWVRWSHLHLDKKFMRIVGEQTEDDIAEAERLGAKGNVVKYDKYRTARLPDELIDILRPLRPAVGDGYVFTEDIRGRDHTAEGRAMRTHFHACGIPEDVLWHPKEPGQTNRTRRPKLTPHDTRSTSACIWTHLLGNNPEKLVGHMGHEDKKTTRLYTMKAVEFEVMMEGWKDEQWHLRPKSESACRVSRVPAGTTKLSLQGPIEDAGVLPVESDIPDDLFVILPDFKGLTTDDESKTG